MAPLNAGSIFQGRLASTIPDHSLRCPSTPGEAKRASTSMAFMSSSGGSTLERSDRPRRLRTSSGRIVRSGLLGPLVELACELKGELPNPRAQPHSAQGRQREAGHAPPCAHVRCDESAAPTDGQIGQAHGEVPALPEHPLSALVEYLWGLTVGAGEGVHHDRHLPPDVSIDPICEELWQLRS